MINDWYQKIDEALEVNKDKPDNPDTHKTLEGLRKRGLIDEDWQVTGELKPWLADRAIVESSEPDAEGKIQTFRCLLPVFGMPGSTTVVISRESLMKDLQAGKHIITAKWDDHLDLWDQGPPVTLTPAGYLTIGPQTPVDHLGELPTFRPRPGDK